MRRTIISIFVFFSLFSYPFFSKSAIVLSGGGAKGAYEVGVWKAMDEYNLIDDITVFSGTSVGALNGALFSCTTPRTAENIWLKQVTKENFLNPVDENSKKIADAIFEAAANKTKINLPISGFLGNLITSLNENIFESFFDIGGKFLDLFNSGHMTGYFSREELKMIIHRVFSIKKLKQQSKTVYAAALEKNHMVTKLISGFEKESVAYFNLTEQSSVANAIDILLASSAVPGAYDSQNLGSEILINDEFLKYDSEYIDGGFVVAGGRNTPVNPVMNHDEVTTVYIVYLKTAEELEEDPPFTFSEVERYLSSNKEFITFSPSEPLGKLLDGTLNFDSEKIKFMINLGYEDGKQTLSSYGFLKPPAWVRYRSRFLSNEAL